MAGSLRRQGRGNISKAPGGKQVDSDSGSFGRKPPKNVATRSMPCFGREVEAITGRQSKLRLPGGSSKGRRVEANKRNRSRVEDSITTDHSGFGALASVRTETKAISWRSQQPLVYNNDISPFPLHTSVHVHPLLLSLSLYLSLSLSLSACLTIPPPLSSLPPVPRPPLPT